MDSPKEINNVDKTQNGVSAASSRVLRKLQTAMDSGNFYEAHQMYRTLYFRYLSQSSKHEELLQLLYDGSTKFLDCGQTTSGCDLALLLVETLQKTNHAVEDTILNKIEGVFERLIQHAQSPGSSTEGQSNLNSIDATPDRDAFLANLIKWSKTVSPKHKYGHPALHARLATTWWRMNNYERARYHFLLSDDGESCANFLIEYHQTKGYPNEVDLFVAQAVFQFLCHKDKPTANAVFFRYVQYHPGIAAGPSAGTGAGTATISKNSTATTEADGGDPPYALPLLNFIWLLLLCIDTGRVTDYSILVEQYQPSIKRDPSYTDYLDRIGQLFFGLPPPKKANASGGAMGGAFLKNLMAGLLGDDNETGEDGPSSADETFESVPGTPTKNETTGAVANDPSPRATARAKLETDEALD